jgi:hypothetical protein
MRLKRAFGESAMRKCFLAALVGAAWVGAAQAGTTAPVLDGNSLWRSYTVFRYTDVRRADGGLESRAFNWYWGGVSSKAAPSALRTPPPPADWTAPEFDDRLWPRTRTPVRPFSFWHSLDYDVAAVLLRGKFEVADPNYAQSLSLSLDYHGGAVVYVNGKEIVRGHVPREKADVDAPAEDYPAEAYLAADGKPIAQGDQKNADRLALRERRLADVPIPAAALRQGVNVLAIEIHRAPVPEAIAGKGGNLPSSVGWAPVGVRNVRLTAAPTDVVVPSRRPAGVQVWTVQADDTVTAFDYGDPTETLHPVQIAAARNGVFSGQLVVSSGEPIKGLKVRVSDLARTADVGAQVPVSGSLPASAVRVRYAEPAVPQKSWAPAHRFDGLVDVIPADVPVIKAAPPRETYAGQPVDRKGLTPGAVATLWLTVRVPKDAQPGSYRGAVTVSAEGLAPTAVPLEVALSAWTVPDPKAFRIQNFGQLSLETQARYYNVPLWSPRHFELIAKSMALMAELNSRQVLVDLCLDFYGRGGNAETLVRWIRQPDGTHRHDFTIFDQYLDLAAKTIGKPFPLRLNCWQEWARPGMKPEGKEQWGLPAQVSLFDPATGQLSALDQPPADSPDFLAFWKPVLDEARKKIEARDWFDVTSVGWNSYCYAPNAVIVDTYRKIWADGVWSYTAHNGTLGGKFQGTEKGLTMPVRFADGVWTHGKLAPRGYQALLMPRPGIWCFTYRGWRVHWDLVYVRDIPECEMMMGHDGVSDFGVDFFPLRRADGRGYAPLGNGRGTGGPNDSTLALLAPGPDGPVATERFEMLREGVELSEAILFIQRALDAQQIPGDLADRVNRYLDQRGEQMVPGWLVNRCRQDADLLTLAGEVASATTKE